MTGSRSATGHLGPGGSARVDRWSGERIAEMAAGLISRISYRRTRMRTFPQKRAGEFAGPLHAIAKWCACR
jgi:hypothetical protein